MPTINKPTRSQTRRNEGKRKERMAIYNSARWRKLREAKMISDPLCEMCLSHGVTRPATDVHHIQSFMDAKDMETRKVLAYDTSNLMSLCDECHSRIHKRGKFSTPPLNFLRGDVAETTTDLSSHARQFFKIAKNQIDK